MTSLDPEIVAYEKTNPIIVIDGLAHPHTVTARTAAALGRTLDAVGNKTSAKRDRDYFIVRVSDSSVDRALRIIDAFAKACDARGFDLRREDNARPQAGLSVFIDGEPIPLLLHERITYLPYRPTRQEVARQRRGEAVDVPAYRQHPSGELTLQVEDWFSRYGLRRVWKDRPSRKLEAQLNDTMLGLRALAAAEAASRRRSEEIDRRIEAFHRERAELCERVVEEQGAVDELEADAEAWRRAQTIRAYIAAVEAQPIDPAECGERAEWAAWARAEADRLDPLTLSPPSILDTPEQDYREFTIWDELPHELYD